MTPLVVRPEPQNHSLCDALRQAGHRPVATPLLAFAPGAGLEQVPALLNQLGCRDYVIAVSAQAVNFADNALKNQGQRWPDATYVAVGEATGQAFAAVGVTNALVPDDPRSEGMIALPQLQQPAGRRAVILRGDGGRHMMAPALAERGAQVEYCEVYRRCYREDTDGQLVKEWQRHGVDSIIITSGGLLQHLFQLAANSAKDWLLSRLLIVPSIRVVEQAKALGFTHIINAKGASNPALLSALDERKRND
ncbi:uroporphyrinogen-III synthase [Oceanimonas marisflavi]|uniref:uroporphyrinogen-III synthase n=1 Tax=Oceanimonas marisflavi TaxID=2059724 RepID=UPI000D30059B|nr:uroporphyrinogen-III synthase [Oceanimonas marisflavi]